MAARKPAAARKAAARRTVRRREPPAAARVFLLSPANCGGLRAKMMLSPNARFHLAQQLQSGAGAPLGEVFSFVSGLYFRGKLAYARRFARPPDPTDPVAAGGVLVITTNAGLRAADTSVTLESFRAFALGDIDLRNASYRGPLEQSARALREAIGPECEVVLLGSVASGKYVDLLLPIFGDRLMFPVHFVGRGDMSRGGLLLRHAREATELDYDILHVDAPRHGPRPPRLPTQRPSPAVRHIRLKRR
jgi:hypothetical protein